MNNEEKKAPAFKTNIIIIVLIALFIVVCFYVFSVHIPYSLHKNTEEEIRQTIVKKNKLTYDHYFYDYSGDSTYYVIRVKVNKKPVYQAYNSKYQLVDDYSGSVAGVSAVKKAIYKKYHVNVSSVHVCYEDSTFMYYAKYQNDQHLYYYYYALNNANFIKLYTL